MKTKNIFLIKEETFYEKSKRELDSNIFNKLESINPFPANKGITEWIIKNYLKDNSILNKTNEIKTGLENFNKLKLTNKIQEKDIRKYTLEQILALNSQIIKSKNEEKKEAEGEAEKLYEDENWLLIIPKTYASSCQYGRNTKWCVSQKDKGKKFKEYTTNGFLMFLINKKNPKEKYSINKEMNTFVNSADIELSSKKIHSLLEVLPKKLAELVEEKGVNFVIRDIKYCINENIPFTENLKKQIETSLTEVQKNNLIKSILSYEPTQEKINQLNFIAKNTKKLSQQVEYILLTLQYLPYKKVLKNKGLI